MGGAAAYQGETNPTYFAVESAKALTPQAGLLLRYNYTPQWTFEFNAHYGSLIGNDADSDTDDRRRRGLSFRTDLITAALQANYNLFGFQPYNMEQPFSPYVFVGAEYFHINPQAEYQGKWVDLQPLGTEGQGMAGRASKYSLHNIAIPVGAGLRWAVSEKWAVGAEFGMRKTFTDYIDDVGGTYVKNADLIKGNGPLAAALGNRTGETGALLPYTTGTTRGSRNDEDWYAFINVSVSHLLYTNTPRGERGRGSKKFGCPKWMRGNAGGKKGKPKSSSRRRY
jgi:opacity protein-like surface antigen